MNLDQLKALGNLGWGWVVVVVAVLLLWEGGKKWLPLLVEKLVKVAASALAGTRLMRRFALRAYREQVAASSARLPVIFGDTGVDVSTVYVPLAAKGAGDADDAYRQIRKADHVVVVGPPGAGKSMLLRHSLLTWALGGGDRRVPVLLELHRCNGNTTALEQLIVEQFARDGFLKADRFVERALHTGGLAVLFDGLDEVNAADRDRVAQLLRDFTRAHEACQIIVTCRSAIYDRQLAPEITSVFRVLDFDERLVRKFLVQWPGLDDVEQLMTALRNSPRIMQLARNPLLLTMIAYLHGLGHQLPHSRAEFYQEATQELLGKLKHAANRFPGPAKKAVLKRLALLAQDVPAHESDRRTLSYEQVLGEVSAMLPRLNIATTDAEAVLREIVHRSGLLLAVDGGERYQFAHLSLQEFLAAEALVDDPDGLIARYRRAPGDWRETVKLWCGIVSTDCGPVIDEVFALDEVLAFECIADANLVDDEVADRVTDYFLGQVYDAGPEVIAALGVVASNRRERGRRVFDFLATEAVECEEAREALAATKLPMAADVLAELEAADDLIRMGDLAIPVLLDLCGNGSDLGPYCLAEIGSPAAAQALASLIWDDTELASTAAWCLARGIQDREIEVALDDVEVVPGLDRHDWVWEPFRDQAHPTVAMVAGRIAHLLYADRNPVRAYGVDERLTFPLCALALNRIARMRWPRGYDPDVDFTPVLQDRALTPAENALVEGVDAETRDRLFRHFVRTPFGRDDWANVHQASDYYEFYLTRLFRLVLVVMAALCGFAAYSALHAGLGWIGAVLGALYAGASLFVLTLVHDDPMLVVDICARPSRIFHAYGTGLLTIGLVSWAWVTLLLELVLGSLYVGPVIAVPVAVAAVTFVELAMRHGIRRERRANNPFFGLLEGQDVDGTSTSVIAS